MFNCCIYNLKGVRTMKRTYVDITGDYYDNLDKIIEWGDEPDIKVYDQRFLVLKVESEKIN